MRPTGIVTLRDLKRKLLNQEMPRYNYFTCIINVINLLLSCVDKKVSKEALDLHLRRTESLNSTRARKLATLRQCALCRCFIKSLWRLRLTVEESCMSLDALIKNRQRLNFALPDFINEPIPLFTSN